MPPKMRKRKGFDERLARRFSQVSGVPLHMMEPQLRFVPGKKGLSMRTRKAKTGRARAPGTFIPTWNKIFIFPEFSEDPNQSARSKKAATKRTVRHERRHSLQKLAAPKRPQADYFRFAEPTNYSPQTTKERRRHERFVRKKLFPRHAEDFLRRYANARFVYRKHGVDGLLLLWVAPPKSMDALDARRWEHEMVDKEYLQPNGGLTSTGLKYWREHLSSQAIFEYLALSRFASPPGLDYSTQAYNTKRVERINRQRKKRGLAEVSMAQSRISKSDLTGLTKIMKEY